MPSVNGQSGGSATGNSSESSAAVEIKDDDTGAKVSLGTGTSTQALRTTLATDVGLPAGASLLGKVGIDQTTPGTTNAVAPIAGVNGVAAGAGVVGTAVQRVTLASDDPAVAILGAAADAASATTTIKAALRGIATALGITALDLGSGTGGTRTLRWFMDTAQWIGGAGVVGTAVQRTTLASDDPAVAVLGATTGAKVITDANGTIQQYLRGLVSQWVAGTLTLASTGYSAAVSLTRTNDTNAYTANDVVGSATGSTAALTFAIGPSAGGEVQITSVSLEIDATAIISGETSYRLYLYNVTPPSAYGDNVAWDIASGDRASFLGYVDLGTPVDLGSTLYVKTDLVNTQIKLASGNAFGLLVTNGAYTPTASRVHVITLHSIAV